MRERIEQIVTESGLWDDGRRESHSFLLSPEVLMVSRERLKALDLLAGALRDCLTGMGCLMAEVSRSTEAPRGFDWFRNAVLANTPEQYRHAHLRHPWKVPTVCMVDMLEDEAGRWWIAEIDGTNKRGFGYAVLMHRIAQTIMPDALLLPGVATSCIDVLRSAEVSKLLLIAPAPELYYRPWFTILKRALESDGVEVEVAFERRSLAALREKTYAVALDWPLTRHRALDSLLEENYARGGLDFLLPPKPFFGSKALLAVLKNELGDKPLEDTLCHYIPPRSLTRVREYIPETYFPGCIVRTDDGWTDPEGEFSTPGDYLIKRTLSSGMKGVLFPDDPNYEAVLKSGPFALHPFRFVIQRIITNRLRPLQFFSADGASLEEKRQLRISCYFDLVKGALADIDVTACQGREIHGGKDALLFGAACES